MDTNVRKIRHDEMVAVLAKDGAKIKEAITPIECHLLHMASCIQGEVAELLDAVVFDPSNRELVIEELGDIEFYFEGVVQGAELHDISYDYDPNYTDLSTALIKAVIISGHIFDVVKKCAIYKGELMKEQLHNRMIQLQGCLNRVRKEYMLSREQTLDANIEKLSKRYKDMMYSDDSALVRADKIGAQQ